MIKVLHTADWHLGKRLDNSERTEEHQLFLEWLLQEIIEASIDVLIIAGDIFDTGAPSNTALKQYYNFLRQVQDTCCQDVIIIGGNHDSVSTLNAPKELLKHFNVHVIGGVPDAFDDQIITIYKDGQPELVVCAVPFLRDRDVRLSIAGETSSEMEARLVEGICNHYKKFIEHILPLKASGIPVLATGHMFAQGASTSDSEQKIHVGNLAQICGDQFPEEFNYVALGHLHRPQVVNGMNHIRYSGSPIPLSFSESNDEKKVVILSFEKGKLSAVEEHLVPPTRRLLRIAGNLEQVKTALKAITNQNLILPCWVEVQITTAACIPNVEEELQEVIDKKPFIERLFIRQIKERPSIADTGNEEEAFTLFELSPKAVFQRRCQSEFGDGDLTELEKTFDLAVELMHQNIHVPVECE